MSNAVRTCAQGWVATILGLVACSGVVEQGSGRQSATGTGAAGGSAPSLSGASTGGTTGTGGSNIVLGVSDGGAPNNSPEGDGGDGGTVLRRNVEETGPSCFNLFTPEEWQEYRCSPLDAGSDDANGCLDLNSTTLRSSDATDVDLDGGTAGGSFVSRPFCSPPVAGNDYLFAVEASGAPYDSLDVATGPGRCEGVELGYLGFGGISDDPLKPQRTYCFLVPGSVLGSRLDVLDTEPDSHVTNLRAVSSCSCIYRLPYNINVCPNVEGSAGHPNCG